MRSTVSVIIQEFNRINCKAVIGLRASSKADDFIRLTSRDARNGGYYHD